MKKTTWLAVAVLTITAVTAALVLSACSKKDNQQPPPVVIETPAPTATATPVVHPSCPVAQAPTLKCYDWAPCNGLFGNKEEALAALVKNDAGGCSRIDGELVKAGFGPCSECHTIGHMQAKSAVSSFEEVLAARDGKTRVEK